MLKLFSLPLFEWIARLGILLLGAFLRFYLLAANSLWVDEILQVLVARQGVAGVIARAARHVAVAPPLDYLVTVFARMLGENEFILRFPAAMWGILVIPAAFALAQRVTHRKRISYFAALFVAVAPMLVRYSQEVRFYSLPVLLSVLIVYTFLRAWQAPSAPRWAIFSVLVFAGLFAYYFVLLIVGVLVVWAFGETFLTRTSQPIRARKWLGFMLAVWIPGIALVAWLFGQGMTGPATKFSFTPPAFTDILTQPILTPQASAIEKSAAAFIASAIILPLCALLALAPRRTRSGALLLALLVGVGVIGILIADARVNYFYALRQVLFLVPFYLLLGVIGLDALIRYVFRAPNLARLALIAASAGFVALGLTTLSSRYHLPKADWRTTAHLLVQSARANDDVMITIREGDEQFLFYYEPSLQENLVPLDELANVPVQEPRVWYVRWSGAEPSGQKALTFSPQWNIVRVNAGPNLDLWYGGKAARAELLRELAELDLPPHVLIYSNVLNDLAALDLELAKRTARRAVDALARAQPPLVEYQQVRFWKRVNKLLGKIAKH